eukprot:gene6808-6499_t
MEAEGRLSVGSLAAHDTEPLGGGGGADQEFDDMESGFVTPKSANPPVEDPKGPCCGAPSPGKHTELSGLHPGPAPSPARLFAEVHAVAVPESFFT